jgi:hypothetical protein
MEHLKQKTRSFTVIEEPDKIDHVLINHVDMNEIFMFTGNHHEKIRFLDRQDDNSLLVCFQSDLQAKEIKLFTVKGKYIEFITELVGREKEPYPENTFRLRIRTCHIAGDSRVSQRHSFTDKIKVTEFVLPIEAESKNEILQNMTMKILLIDIEKSLDKYTYGKVFLRNSESIPPEVQFVQETDILLYLKDTSKLRDFIENNKAFFFNKKELMRDLLKRVPTIQNSYRSMIIQPIEYMTMNGIKLTLGHIMIASKESELNEDDLINLAELCSAVFEKMKLISRKSYPIEADVNNISPDGAMIHICDPGIVQKMISMDNMMFSLKFPFQKALMVSGNIIYITCNNKQSFHVGIDFTGSRYGKNLKKMIEIYIKNFMINSKTS